MKIFGNTVGTTLPKPNLMQTDPKKGDYVKGKDEFREIPTFDLYEMGLPTIYFSDDYIVVEADCSALREALSKGPVFLKARYGTNNEYVVSTMASGIYYEAEDAYLIVINHAYYDGTREDPFVPVQGLVGVGTNALMASYREMQKALPEWKGGSY